MRARDPDFYLSSIPLSPSKYLKPAYRNRSVATDHTHRCETERATDSHFHFPRNLYHRHKSKDLSPFTLPQFARMDDPQRLLVRRQKLLQDLREKKSQLEERSSRIRKRNSLIRDLSERFRVTFTKKEKVGQTEWQLKETALRKVNMRIVEKSCRTIQRTWRQSYTKRVSRLLELRSHFAARRIQRFWRRHLLARSLRASQQSAALTIQRYWRGYRYSLCRVRRTSAPTLERIKLARSLGSLQDFRQRILVQSAQVIWYHWKKFKQRRSEKKRIVEPLPLIAIPEDDPLTSKSVEVALSPHSPKKSEDISFHSLEGSPKPRLQPVKSARR